MVVHIRSNADIGDRIWDAAVESWGTTNWANLRVSLKFVKALSSSGYNRKALSVVYTGSKMSCHVTLSFMKWLQGINFFSESLASLWKLSGIDTFLETMFRVLCI